MKHSISKVFVAVLLLGHMSLVSASPGAQLLSASANQPVASVANNLINTTGEAFKSLVKLTSKLSNDIGIMADRILSMADKIGEMADRIGVMADRIGEMADRIVKTEELMAQLVATLADKQLPAGGSADLATRLDRIESMLAGSSTVLITATDHTGTASYGPTLNISNTPESYLLYVSFNGLFAEGKTVITLVDAGDQGSFDTAWASSIRTLSSASQVTQVTVAVKAVTANGGVSYLSNGLEITLQSVGG